MNNPSARVDNVKNFRQVLVLAHLFEAMTNLVVEYGAVVYYTRRRVAYVVTFPIRLARARPFDAEEAFDGKVFESSLLAPLDGGLRVLYSDYAHRVALARASQFDTAIWKEDEDRTAVEVHDKEDPVMGGPPRVQEEPRDVFPNRVPFAPVGGGAQPFPDLKRVVGGEEEDEDALVLVRDTRAQPADDDAGIAIDDALERELEEVSVGTDESGSESGDGGGGGGGDESSSESDGESSGGGGGSGGDESGSESDGESSGGGGGSGGDIVGSVVIGGEGDAPPFVGAGPADFDRRVRTTDDVGQRDLYEAVKEEASDMADDVRHRLSARRLQAILDDVDAFYLFLRQFTFRGRGVVPPDDWDEQVVRARDGRFAPMSAASGGRMDRMRDEFLNPPKDDEGEPSYPTHRNDPDTGAYRRLTDDEKHGQIESILCRTLNRLVNDRVQRVYILPGVADMERDDPVHPRNTGVTVREVAEHFLHNSQRAFWQPAALQWALEAALPEERATLWAKVLSYNTGVSHP